MIAQPFVGGAARVALVPQHVQVDGRQGQWQILVQQGLRHARRGDQMARQDGDQVGIGDDSACREELVDRQQDAPFAVDLRQRFVDQAMRAAGKAHQ